MSSGQDSTAIGRLLSTPTDTAREDEPPTAQNQTARADDGAAAQQAKQPLFQLRLTSGLIYSDNIRLAPSGAEENDTVAELRPGFTLQRKTQRLEASLNYDMRNFYSTGDNETDTHHQLDGVASLELIEERFAVETRAYLRQNLVDGRNNLGADIISNPDEFSDVYAYRISPVWRGEFSDYAELQARYSYDNVHYERDIADSEAHSIELDITDGRRFSVLDWQVRYFNRVLKRDRTEREQRINRDDRDSSQEQFLAQVSYPLNDDWAVAGRFGFEHSNVIVQTDEEDGSFWSLGLLWTPSRFFDARVFYGPNENELGFRYNPSSRTSFKINRLDRDVGLNIGEIWSGTLAHRSRYSNWSASYSEGTISGATLAFEDPFVAFEDSENVPTLISDQNQTLDTSDVFTTTSSDFERQRWQARVSYKRARTFASIGGFHERRNFDADIPSETGHGVLASLARVLNPRTTAVFSVDWERSEISATDQDTELLILQAALAHAFTRDVSAGLSYRYAQREASNSEQDFQENRVSALMRLKF